ECKRLETFSEGRIAKHIQKANKQLKAAGSIGLGIVVLDVTSALPFEVELSDETPIEIGAIAGSVAAAISGPKNRSVSRVVLVWDEAGILGVPPDRTMIHLRRRFLFVDHSPSDEVKAIPKGTPLFEGSTVLFRIKWDASAIGIETLRFS